MYMSSFPIIREINLIYFPGKFGPIQAQHMTDIPFEDCRRLGGLLMVDFTAKWSVETPWW